MFDTLARNSATYLCWGLFACVTGGCDVAGDPGDLAPRDLAVRDLATTDLPPSDLPADLALPWRCAALSRGQACAEAELIGCEPRFACSGNATAMLCNLGSIATDGPVSGELVAEDANGRRHCTVSTTIALAPNTCESVSCGLGVSGSTGTLTFYANQGTDGGTIPECRADNNITVESFDCML